MTAEKVEEGIQKETVVAHQEQKAERTRSSNWFKILLCSSIALFALYIFLVGLSLMGSSFKVLGGRGASSMFTAVDNPISGLMTGVLATVLVQSSSTSTSIVVAMVGEGALTVRTSIPIIMGANIGTSVTNTLVSMGQSSDPVTLQRAFAGATVHDMFNMLSVLTLLPLEVITGAIHGGGGVLYWLSHWITESLMGGEARDPLFTSPVKLAAAPVVDQILKANKYVIYALTLEKPQPHMPLLVNQSMCAALSPTNGTRRLSDSDSDSGSGLYDCGQYYCVGKDLDKQFSKISKSSYAKLTECTGFILDAGGDPCGGKKCYLDGGRYYEDKVENGRLIKGGFLEGTSDAVGGIIGLITSLILLCMGLFGLCRALQTIFLGNAEGILRRSTRLNGYVAILIGVAITILVQSSSVTTSALTPLCGLGVLPLDKMLPLTLGANIGTTVTALLASLVSLKFAAVQIALSHLLFNLIGILIWYPFPPMRQIPLGAARLLGLYAAHYKLLPAIYIAITFVALPGLCLLLRELFQASIPGGTVVLIFVLGCAAVFEYLWLIGVPRGNALCYKVLSREARGEAAASLEALEAAKPATQGGHSTAEDEQTQTEVQDRAGPPTCTDV